LSKASTGLGKKSSPMDHCLSPARARHGVDAATAPQRYARMFPEVPAFTADEEFLHALGRAGGICDCGAETDDRGSEGESEAGWPIFGQFVAHDVTADRSALQVHADVSELRNARSPKLNLEGLYGDGPVGHPFLFQREDPAKFLLGAGGDDLPRNAEGIALCADPRDDSHLLVSQIHLAMLKVHNAFVNQGRAAGVENSQVFAYAARHALWSYHWVVVREFLPTLVGQALVDELLKEGPRYYRPHSEPFIPLEFADAAYRYGHCQIRRLYQVNRRSAPLALFPELLGFRAVPRERRVEWDLFFDVPGGRSAQRAKKIDGKLVRPLIQLPSAITGEMEVADYHSLAMRDLQRGQGTALPSGEALARHLHIPPLSPSEVGLIEMGWRGETPLWYYILREADIRTGGNRLGPLGGRLVAEVLIGLLRQDSTSLLNAGADWRPNFGRSDQTSLADLFAWAELAS
jgi:Animal haem peroxidase